MVSTEKLGKKSCKKPKKDQDKIVQIAVAARHADRGECVFICWGKFTENFEFYVFSFDYRKVNSVHSTKKKEKIDVSFLCFGKLFDIGVMSNFD